jgi:cell fate (sporulation/competence/biofilm development) regulator YlbF (YheA/YmcA/DUF963 family)
MSGQQQAHDEITQHLSSIGTLVEGLLRSPDMERLEELQRDLEWANRDAEELREKFQKLQQEKKQLLASREGRTIVTLAQELEDAYRDNEKLRADLESCGTRCAATLGGFCQSPLRGQVSLSAAASTSTNCSTISGTSSTSDNRRA